MVPRPKRGHRLISLLDEKKKLYAEPLLHLHGSFVRKGEGHDFRNGQWVRLSHEEVKDAIDENRGLTSPSSSQHDNIAVPGCLRQDAILGIRECQELSHRWPSVFSTCVELEPEVNGTNATRSWHRGVGRHRRIRRSRNSHQEE